ncbi:MAG: class I tRNA ligase family protein [Nanoarchaeota archaeon]|nr:class I tRNA ligase family protein [Nanoarchaeota archaeon]
MWKVKKIIPGLVPVDEKDLPLVLPHEVKFGKGNPLETNKDWVNVKCPKCGGKARRETDTMDTFVNSSWYYLRYCDPHNDKEIFDKKKVAYWCPIDLYIGGAEHACLHLIFVRFYAKFLADLGLVNFREPAKKLFHQGILHAEGGERMSKSKGNVVLPETVSSVYGIDTARYFLCSLASPDKDIDWSEKGISGSLRFVNRIFAIFEKIKIGKDSPELLLRLNKAIKNVTFQIENFEYRKASIELKELFEFFSGQNEISKDSLLTALKLLSPFCPHIAEELNEKLENKNFISLSEWPKPIEIKSEEKTSTGNLNEKLISEIRYQMSKSEKSPTKIFVYIMPFEIGKLDEKLISENFDAELKIFAVNDKDKYDPENKSKKAKPGKAGIYLE